MNPTVTVHSDANGVTRSITLAKTGPNEGHIAIASSAAPGSAYDLKNIGADPASLSLSCQVDALFSADIALSVKRGANGNLPVATIIVSHALIGSGSYVYPIRATEDQRIQDFLVQAAFPPMS